MRPNYIKDRRLRRLGALILTLVWLSGCAGPKPKLVDGVKSCEALLYEAETIGFTLERTAEAAEEARNREVPLHIFVIAIGTAVSVQPYMLSGEYFYVGPAATIAYYNYYAKPPEVLERYDYLSERREVLARLIEEKACNTTKKP
ncbi:MAG: hypothetical protein AB7E49_00490 [Campylobacterales bacterium]